MAAKEFGGEVPVDHTSTILTLEKKRDKERHEIAQLLLRIENLEDFEAFNALVVELQSSIRALNVLRGKCTLQGWGENEDKVVELSAPTELQTAVDVSTPKGLLSAFKPSSNRGPVIQSRTGPVDLEKLEADALGTR